MQEHILDLTALDIIAVKLLNLYVLFLGPDA